MENTIYGVRKMHIVGMKKGADEWTLGGITRLIKGGADWISQTYSKTESEIRSLVSNSRKGFVRKASGNSSF